MTKELVQEALKDVTSLQQKLETLLSNFRENGVGRTKPVIKQSNGRLTEAGVRELRNMIDAGRADADIARELDITQPAVYHQRQRYLADKFAPKRRR